MPTRLRPLSDRVVVVPDEHQEVVGTLVIPDSVRTDHRPQTGVIKWVGPGRVSEFPVICEVETPNKMLGEETSMITYAPQYKRMPMYLKVGMRVLYGKYSGADVQIERDNYVVLRQTDIFAILEDDDESE